MDDTRTLQALHRWLLEDDGGKTLDTPETVGAYERTRSYLASALAERRLGTVRALITFMDYLERGIRDGVIVATDEGRDGSARLLGQRSQPASSYWTSMA